MSESNDRRACPWCGGRDTERVDRQWGAGSVRETRVCIDCELEYSAEFNSVEKRVERQPAEAFQ